MKTTSWLNWLWIGIAIAVPVFTAVWAIVLSLPLPVYDYWDILGVVQNLAARGPDHWLRFLWEPFVDQKMVGPKLLIWGLSQLTDNRHLALEIAFGFVMQLGVLVISVHLAQHTAGIPYRRNGFWWAFASALLFWPFFLFRFQHHWYSTQYSLVLLPAMGAIALLANRRPSRVQVSLAALLALIAGLSHGTGLFLWPVLGLSLMFQRRTWWAGVVWLVTSVLLIILIASQQPSREALGFLPLSVSFQSLDVLVFFVLRCLGLSVFPLSLGIVILVLAGVAVYILARRGLLKFYRPWLIIWGWTLLAAGGSALNRSTVLHNPSYYYSAFFILCWIATGVLLSGVLPRNVSRSPGMIWGCWVALVCGLSVWGLGSWKGIDYARNFSRQINQASLYLKSWPVVERCRLAPLFPEPRFERSILPILAKRQAFGLDPRPLIPLDDVGIKRQCVANGLILIPTRALTSHEMVVFSDNLLSIEALEIILHGHGMRVSRQLLHYEGQGWLVWGEYPDAIIERIELRGLSDNVEFESRVYGRKGEDPKDLVPVNLKILEPQ